jgi:hypothetical protein
MEDKYDVCVSFSLGMTTDGPPFIAFCLDEKSSAELGSYLRNALFEYVDNIIEDRNQADPIAGALVDNEVMGLYMTVSVCI